jgi:poly(A) polymerase
VTLLSCADRLATRGKNAERAIDAHLELARELMPAALDWRRSGPPRLPVKGDELAAALGIEPGPELGRLLAELEEAAYAGEINGRDDAIELGRRLRDNAVR